MTLPILESITIYNGTLLFTSALNSDISDETHLVDEKFYQYDIICDQ